MQDQYTDWQRQVIRLPGALRRLHVWHPPGQPAMADLLRQFHAGLLPALSPVNSSTRSQVFTGPLSGQPGAFYFKRMLRRNALDVLKHCVRASRARRAWRNSLALLRDGIGADQPVGLAEERVAGMVTQSLLVTAAIEEAPRAIAWLLAPSRGLVGHPAAKRRFLEQLAEHLGRAHARGWDHADLHLGNILCRRAGDDYRFFWIDTEGVRRHRHLPLRRRLSILCRLSCTVYGLTRTDRLRLWRTYLRHWPLDPAGADRAARAINAMILDDWSRRPMQQLRANPPVME